MNDNPIHTKYRNLNSVLCHLQELKLIGLDIPHFAADLPLNRCKNRYTNILPCKIVTRASPIHVSQRLTDCYCRFITFSNLWLSRRDPLGHLCDCIGPICALMLLYPILCRNIEFLCFQLNCV